MTDHSIADLTAARAAHNLYYVEGLCRQCGGWHLVYRYGIAQNDAAWAELLRVVRAPHHGRGGEWRMVGPDGTVRIIVEENR